MTEVNALRIEISSTVILGVSHSTCTESLVLAAEPAQSSGGVPEGSKLCAAMSELSLLLNLSA